MGCSVPQGRHSLYGGFSHIKHPIFDALFDQLETQQLQFATLQAERQNAQRRIEKELGYTATIKKPEAEDIVTAVLLCYSASCGGDLGQLDFSVSESLPFLHVQKHSLQPCFQAVAEEWPRFIQQMTVLGGRLRQVRDAVSSLACDLRSKLHIDLYEHEEELITGCHKERNLTRIKKNIATAASLSQQIRKEYKIAEAFQSYCRSLMEGYSLENKLKFVKEAGRCAFDAAVFDVHRLVEDYYLAGEDFVM